MKLVEIQESYSNILIFLLSCKSPPVYFTISPTHSHPAGEEIQCLLSCLEKQWLDVGISLVAVYGGKRRRLASLCLLKILNRCKTGNQSKSVPIHRDDLCVWIRVGYQTNTEVCLFSSVGDIQQSPTGAKENWVSLGFSCLFFQN